jgi:hypothetical protein
MATTNSVTLPLPDGAATAAPKGAESNKTPAAKKPAAARKVAAVKKPTPVKKPVAAKKAAPAKKAVAVKKVATAKPVADKKVVGKVAKPAKSKASSKEASKVAAAPKAKKEKLVRDSFSMPETEYAVLGAVKKACLKAGIEVKKSELLRIGVALIRKMDVTSLKNVLATLPPLKAGRPKQEK